MGSNKRNTADSYKSAVFLCAHVRIGLNHMNCRLCGLAFERTANYQCTSPKTPHPDA